MPTGGGHGSTEGCARTLVLLLERAGPHSPIPAHIAGHRLARLHARRAGRAGIRLISRQDRPCAGRR
ncbi:hypothetical protein trd_A0684 (plasmid) [Thermomicrobium roseum DSM 5159]|uniref:Uncharacterized protein n=1 Tax=Thermomicrobium roseum (strain ATCC 27502 / DSM 5159 / P-2) TaxID=309801 RepID=B9L4H0_THERP|nr:hypothetical protein trd_A0684 [Thermomicrobium roseum DSM 5159]